MRTFRRISFLAAATLFSAAPALAGTLVVLNKSEADVTFLNADTGREISRIPVGDGPHEAATSPDGKTIVVCNYGGREPGSTLSVIERNGRRMKSSLIKLGNYHRPHGIVFLSDGDRVVVTAEAEKKLLIVNIRNGAVEAAIDTDQETSHMVALTPNEELAFVANIRSGSVSVIDLVKKELVKVIPTGSGAEGVYVHPTRPEVWVTNRSANTISIIDTNSLDIVRTLDSGRVPIRVSITPDGKHALVSCADSGDVWVYEVESRKKIAAIAMDAEAITPDERQKRLFGDQFEESPVPVGILIEPNGKRAFVANTNADVITVIDLETWRIAGRMRAGKEPDGMTWID